MANFKPDPQGQIIGENDDQINNGTEQRVVRRYYISFFQGQGCSGKKNKRQDRQAPHPLFIPQRSLVQRPILPPQDLSVDIDDQKEKIKH